MNWILYTDIVRREIPLTNLPHIYFYTIDIFRGDSECTACYPRMRRELPDFCGLWFSSSSDFGHRGLEFLD
jgi:hypothetical protein